jgi:NDP-sugar pyrophosphorylase family protein
MALIPNPNPSKYGGVLVTDDGFVAGFSRPGTAAPSFHFIGVQAIETRAFERLDDGVKHESVGALYPELMRENRQAVAAFLSDARFEDIGTPADCLQTSLRLAEREGSQLIGSRADIADDVVLERTALWDDVKVGRGVRLIECVVGDGACVPAGMTLTRCAIVPAGSRPPAPDERVERGLLIRPFHHPPH